MKNLDDMDEYIFKYHIEHGCDKNHARFLAWMNSNWCETNAYFQNNKDKTSIKYELYREIDKVISNFIKNKHNKV